MLWRLLLLVPPILMVWSFAPLKYVAMDDTCLYVSNYRRELRIPLSQVVEVRERRGSRNAVRDVTIRLASPTEFGDKIRFIPRLILWPGTAALQEATAQIETDRGAAATALWSSFSVAEAIRQRVQQAVPTGTRPNSFESDRAQRR